MDYVFKVTGKGLHGAPKGLSVTVVRKGYSTPPSITEIAEAFQKQHGIKVGGVPSCYDIKKL